MTDLKKLPIVLTILHPDLQLLAQQYCQHTGKPCSRISDQEIADSVQSHGFETTKILLQMKKQSVSMEWLWLNSEGLDALARLQPKEYFIYACCTLLFPAEQKVQSGKACEFEAKIQAWRNLQFFDSAILKPISETIRRLLAKCPPHALATILVKAFYTDIVKLTKSEGMLLRFQLSLDKILKDLIAGKLKLVIAEEHIAGGLQAFAKQKMLLPLSSLEKEVFNELNDLELIKGKSDFKVALLTGDEYRKADKKFKLAEKNLPANSRYETAKVINPIGARLRLK